MLGRWMILFLRGWGNIWYIPLVMYFLPGTLGANIPLLPHLPRPLHWALAALAVESLATAESRYLFGSLLGETVLSV